MTKTCLDCCYSEVDRYNMDILYCTKHNNKVCQMREYRNPNLEITQLVQGCPLHIEPSKNGITCEDYKEEKE